MTTLAEVDCAGVPFGTRLEQLARSKGDGPALTTVAVDGGQQTLSWSQLDRCANQWGRALANAGAGAPGALVALAIPNCQELVLAALGCWKIGAVPIPMRWDLPDWELHRVLEVIGAPVIVDEQVRDRLAETAVKESESAVPESVSPMMNGICSSGSSGLPKVILNTRPALWAAEMSEPFVAQWAPVPRPQTILVMGPMYHTNGFGTLNYLLGGDQLVVMEKFDAARVIDLVEQHRVTHFIATPTMLARLAAVPHIGRRDLSSVQWILQGAAMMPPALLHKWFDLLGPDRIVMAYGMTENLGLTALRGDEWLEHPGSVGRGFRDTEIDILGPGGEPLPPGQVGDIYLRSPMNACYRYLGDTPPLPVTAQGFRTVGDLGRLDADGYLYLADRRTDLIVTGGANVFPAEVECALIEHEAIADVVVLGLSDPEWGRRVHAVIEPADPARPPTVEEVIRYAKSRLAPYKAPKTVEFVKAIPRSATTKVNRTAMLREREG